MKPSPLDLSHYFVTHLLMSANPDFDEEQPTTLHREDIQVGCDVRQTPETGPDDWLIVLNLRQNANPEKNAPYNFAVQITGLFRVHPGWSDDPERLVRTNGPTMLFGACREIIRALTAQGPFRALVLPSVSFYTPETGPKAEPRKSLPVKASRPAGLPRAVGRGKLKRRK